jgi:hypothetical protein
VRGAGDAICHCQLRGRGQRDQNQVSPAYRRGMIVGDGGKLTHGVYGTTQLQAAGFEKLGEPLTVAQGESDLEAADREVARRGEGSVTATQHCDPQHGLTIAV